MSDELTLADLLKAKELLHPRLPTRRDREERQRIEDEFWRRWKRVQDEFSKLPPKPLDKHRRIGA